MLRRVQREVVPAVLQELRLRTKVGQSRQGDEYSEEAKDPARSGLFGSRITCLGDMARSRVN